MAENLHLAMEGESGEDLRQELCKLIERVDFLPMKGLGKSDLRVHGSLAVLLGLGGAQNAGKPPRRLPAGALMSDSKKPPSFRRRLFVFGCGSRI